MGETGNPAAFKTIDGLRSLNATELGAVTADWIDIRWWANAMLRVAPQLSQVLEAIESSPAADPTTDTAFMRQRKALEDILSDVGKNTRSAFGDGWGLLVMFNLSNGARPSKWILAGTARWNTTFPARRWQPRSVLRKILLRWQRQLFLLPMPPGRPTFALSFSETAPEKLSPGSTRNLARTGSRTILTLSSVSATRFKAATIGPSTPNGGRFWRCLRPIAAIESSSRLAITTSGRPCPRRPTKNTRGTRSITASTTSRRTSRYSTTAAATSCRPRNSPTPKDLELHKNQPLKFIVSHRPSWILNAVLGNPGFPLHQLAKRYGVKYVIAGHIHQMLHFEVEGVTYLSMPSSGGHLRLEKQYDKGWFFAHTLVSVVGDSASFEIKEAAPPYGQSRVSKLSDWGAAGRNVYSRIQ